MSGLLRRLAVEKVDRSTDNDGRPCWGRLTDLTRLELLCINNTVELGGLPDLEHLPAIHTLHATDYLLPLDCGRSFKHLHSLCLSGGREEVCNLTSCTQITSLELRTTEATGQVILPAGEDVQLECLIVEGTPEHVSIFSLENLAAAQT